MLAKQPGAHGVERGRGHPSGQLLAEQVGEPQTELAGRADAERDREDLRRLCGAGGEQVGDPVRQGSGLSGTRAGDQQQRTGPVGHGLRLLGRESGEQRIGRQRRVIASPRLGMWHPSPPSVSGSIDRGLRLGHRKRNR